MDSSLGQTLDELRSASREAFVRRDLKGFMAAFATDFEWRGADGVVWDRPRYERSVGKQMRDLTSIDAMSFEVDERWHDGEDVVERVRTTTRATVVAFWVLVRAMRVERVQLTRWRRGPEGWRIRRMEVLEETVTVNGKVVTAPRAGRPPRPRS